MCSSRYTLALGHVLFDPGLILHERGGFMSGSVVYYLDFMLDMCDPVAVLSWRDF